MGFLGSECRRELGQKSVGICRYRRRCRRRSRREARFSFRRYVDANGMPAVSAHASAPVVRQRPHGDDRAAFQDAQRQRRYEVERVKQRVFAL